MKTTDHEIGHGEQLIQIILIIGVFTVYFWAGLGLAVILGTIKVFDYCYEQVEKKLRETFFEEEIC